MTYTRIANDSSSVTTTTSPPSGTLHRGITGISSINTNNNTDDSNNSTPQQQQQQAPTTNLYFLDKKVDSSIETFLTKSLIQIGPELLSGNLTLSFFERRASKQLFGLVSHEEKVIWEQWIIRIVVNNTPRPVADDKASIMERQRIQDTAERMLRSVFLKIYDCASGIDDMKGGINSSNGGGINYEENQNDGESRNAFTSTNTSTVKSISSGVDHIPPSMYEFEIKCSKRHDERENVISRVTNMPPLLNLDGS